mgnify:CR=1 FL=1
MFQIILVPILGLIVWGLLKKLFPKSQFHSYVLLPFFFVFACQLITDHERKPSFLPYGFLLYALLAVIIILKLAFTNKNLSVSKTLGILWECFTWSSGLWYAGLLITLF